MRPSKSTQIPGVALLLLAMAFSIFPLLSMFSTALQPQGSVPVGLSWPGDPQWHNFVDAFQVANLGPLFDRLAALS